MQHVPNMMSYDTSLEYRIWNRLYIPIFDIYTNILEYKKQYFVQVCIMYFLTISSD